MVAKAGRVEFDLGKSSEHSVASVAFRDLLAGTERGRHGFHRLERRNVE